MVVRYHVKDIEGIVTQHMEYMPYGEPRLASSPTPKKSIKTSGQSLVEEHQNSINTPYKFNGKEQDDETGNYYYGARYYNPKFSFWLSVDPLAHVMTAWSPYSYCFNSPVLYTDPDGRYPIITITKRKTGKKVKQRMLGFSGSKSIDVDLYHAVVTDTEDKNFRLEFTITRDAWVVAHIGDKYATNVAFEPKDGYKNLYEARVMRNGYPENNGTEALKLYQYDSQVIHAEANETSVERGYRYKKDVASGVMLHVGGFCDLQKKMKLAASEGCFGITDSNNSNSTSSNSYSNDILNRIKAQATKSKTHPDRIHVLIEKRTGNEYPATKNIE